MNRPEHAQPIPARSPLLRRALAHALVGVGLLCAAGAWAAPTVSYTATQDSASTWHYDYLVSGPIDLFGGVDIVFAWADYANLVASSSDPSLLVNQPDSVTPLDGDVFATFDTAALAAGSQASFSVSFDWSGSGAPGSQSFNVFDANGNTVAAGVTAATSTGAVPEPSAAALVALALGGLALSRRRSA